MRVRSILFLIGSLQAGGAERVVSVLADYCNRKEIDVVIGLLGENVVKYQLNERVKVIPIPHKNLEMNSLSRNISRVQFIYNLIKEVKPTIVLSLLTECNIFACIARLFINVPLVISERNDPYRDPTYRKVRLIRKLVYRLADGYIFQTEAASSYFSRKIALQGCVIPNPIGNNLPEINRSYCEKKVCAIGRLSSQKNFSLLIKAFAKARITLTDYTLHIFGEGNDLNSLKLLAKKLNVSESVVFEGNVTDIHQQIQHMSMFVLSSDYEGISNALLEAMGMGLPCIATDCPCGGSRMLIEDGVNGILIPVGDENEMTSSIIKLAQNPDLAQKLGFEAQKARISFSSEYIGGKYLAYFEERAQKFWDKRGVLDK